MTIVKEYEERETAAKQGRPVFLSMVRALKSGKASGVIMHKIDRSARNLKDWADLGTLIDQGMEVHFANEGLDLHSRGGRLSADIQAVIASDYIRNLREETKKGIYGRLKQGLFPFRAIVGYLDAGGGKPKRLDPVKAPLIKKLFELYSTGNWSHHTLSEEMCRLGLRSRNGRKIDRNGIAQILHSPFYMGVIRLKTVKEVFIGKHEPIVSKQLFDSVQEVLAGKVIKKVRKHFFVFSRHVKCSKCGRNLIAEKQKGYAYYRCHTKECKQKTVREEVVEERFVEVLKSMKFSKMENDFLKQKVREEGKNVISATENQMREIYARLEQFKERFSRLADAYMDGVFDRATYALKKNALVLEEKDMREHLQKLMDDPGGHLRFLEEILERANSAYTSYKKASPSEKRELVKTVTSNFVAQGKTVSIKPNLPFQMIAKLRGVKNGGPYGASTRNCERLFKKLCLYFKEESNSKNAQKFGSN